MSKFDDVISTKMKQLVEAAPLTGATQAGGVTPAAGAQTAAQTGATNPQSQPQEQQDPSTALADVFKKINFNDANSVVDVFNKALKGAPPTASKVFASLMFDPQKSAFAVAQQQAQQGQQVQQGQQAQSTAPGTKPLQ